MEIIYLFFLNLGDMLHLLLYLLPCLFSMIFSMWQTWVAIGAIFLLFLAEGAIQYFFIDRYETLD